MERGWVISDFDRHESEKNIGTRVESKLFFSSENTRYPCDYENKCRSLVCQKQR